MKIKKELLDVQKNILLKNYTTFKIGGRAKYFFTAKTKEDLIKALQVAKKLNLPFFILGGGSNILAADKGFNGLIIKTQNSRVKSQNHNLKLKTIYTEAGIKISDLVKLSLEKSLTGFEWAIGIPGTIGGAIRGNAGAFGKEIKNIIKKVEVFNIKNQKSKTFKNKDCKFKYRDSIFKQNPNLIILSAEFHLKKDKKSGIQKKIKECLNYRKKNQPLNFPSAGSIFKNPKIKINLTQKLLKEFPEFREIDKKQIIPVGWLIEKCGIRGKRIGNVKISEKHCNFIINLGGGKAKDVRKLIKLIKQKVKKKFKIDLAEEICYLGFKN